ncbi:MAG: hypothetical protein E7261_10295 [Lachnospiraceae bacterium]|nr:hypothetical protein [Lachnospiraceae bacterium]
MRITNGMMINNALRDINNNKLNLDRYNTQLSTEKRIQKPSEDPIIAIRALRFRSNLAEIDQYLERNIPDAESWIKVTEDALIGARDMTQSLQEDLTQGANETLGTDERDAIVKNLQAYRDQIFQNANADYANRSIFTGYKTASTMTFEAKDEDIKYVITQKLTATSLDRYSVVQNNVAPSELGPVNVDEMPYMVTNHRVRLAYNKLDIDIAGGINTGLSLTDEDGNAVPGLELETVYLKDGVYKNAAGDEVDPYDTSGGKNYLIADSGEIIFSESGYTKYVQSTENGGVLSLTYQKTGFEKGELKPEHYFECELTTATATETFEYSGAPQDIEYTVNFEMKLKVNTEGRDVFSHDIIRDVDELINCVALVSQIEENITNIEKKIAVSEGAEKENLETVKEALEKEFALAEEVMQKRFEEGITEFQLHQQKFDLAITEVGNRGVRLKLNKERLTSQQTNIEELKSKNEDADLAETAILLTTSKDVYEASLSAAAKLTGNNLLDFIR